MSKILQKQTNKLTNKQPKRQTETGKQKNEGEKHAKHTHTSGQNDRKAPDYTYQGRRNNYFDKINIAQNTLLQDCIKSLEFVERLSSVL